MIVQSATKPAIVMSSEKPSSFRIKEDKKTFKAFSDGLYSDKIGSIIRELSSNAVDIHNKINNHEPFDIFLPCDSNPYFSIRDYGTGLTPNEIDNIYTVIGESTKDQENSSIGGFGLGSKTPFAYVDQYFVRSYKDSVAYTYCFFFSEDEPQFVLTSEIETKEKNGLEIFFLVDPDDFVEFKNKAKNIIPWFSIVPNVYINTTEDNSFFVKNLETENIRSSIIKNHKEDIYFENDFFYIHSKNYLNLISFEQGGVVYSLGTNTFESMELLKNINNNLNYQTKITFKSSIGTLELQRSREALSLSKKITIPAINKIIGDILLLAEETCSPLFDNYDNLNEFNKRKLFHTIRQNKNNVIYKYSKINNIEILNFYINIILSNIDHISNNNIKKIILENKNTNYNIKNHEICNISDIRSYSNTRNGFKKRKENKDVSLFNFEKILVIFRDGYKTNLNFLFDLLEVDNNDFVFVVDVQKKNINESKTSFFEKVETKFLDYFNADHGDIIFIYESKKGITKEKISPSLGRTRQSYKNSIDYLDIKNSFLKIRNIDEFKNKNVLIVKKSGQFADFNGEQIDRQQAMSKAFSVAFSNSISDIDYVVCANKRETSEIIESCANFYHLNELNFDKKINNDIQHIIDLKEKISILEFKEDQHLSGMTNNDILLYNNICKYFSIDNQIDVIKEEIKLLKQEIKEKEFDLRNKYNIKSFFSYEYFINKHLYDFDINYFDYITVNYQKIDTKKTISYKINKIIENNPIFNLLSFHGKHEDEIEKHLFSYFDKIKLKKTLF